MTTVLPQIDPGNTYSFGSSTTLGTQIKNGAPADVLMSANTTVPASLFAAGVVTGRAISDSLAKVAQHDPTGLLNLLPFGDNFRYYSVTGGVPVADQCSCSREKICGILEGFSAQEISDSTEHGGIHVACEFCSKQYDFDPAEFAANQ